MGFNRGNVRDGQNCLMGRRVVHLRFKFVSVELGLDFPLNASLPTQRFVAA
jgi:hypothetical protein